MELEKYSVCDQSFYLKLVINFAYYRSGENIVHFLWLMDGWCSRALGIIYFALQKYPGLKLERKQLEKLVEVGEKKFLHVIMACRPMTPNRRFVDSMSLNNSCDICG